MKNLKQTLTNSNLIIIKSTNGTEYVLADKMYTATSNIDFGYSVYTLRTPSLTRSVVRRILKTPGHGRTRAYSTFLGLDVLRIGCQTFLGNNIKGLQRWAER
jgi:hypothetical protein